MIELAPAKINLCLFLGPTRSSDGRHELVTVMQPLAFGDDVRMELADADAVVCPGVEGPNLAAAALAAFRAARPGTPPVALTIAKRIPVAAGMAGGSADAGAALRLAARAAGVDDEPLLLELAAGLGADVPAQVRPGRVLATGAGERLERLGPPPRPHGVLVVPSEEALSTAAVFREADRLGLARTAEDLAVRLAEVRAALAPAAPASAASVASASAAPAPGAPAAPPSAPAAPAPDAPAAPPPAAPPAFGLPAPLVVNDLEPAARSLCPSIGAALDRVRAAGADHALVSGSGPTVLGLFADPAAAARAAAELPGSIATTTLGEAPA